jgi:putative ABC transport system ATP-binding protein
MGPSLIRTVGLRRDYPGAGGTVAALRGVSLDVEVGDYIAIMGPSGSGKTSLMNILGFLDSPTAGTYALAGCEVGGLKPDALATLRRRVVGFVYQDFNLLRRNSAIENVELPLIYDGVPKADRTRRAAEALEAVGMAHRRDHWPHQLSGGEQQRVAIARAIAGRPALILADEPTGALDSRTGQEFLGLFRELNRQRVTIILVTHDADVAHEARRIVTLRDGRIVGDERPAPVAEPGGRVSATSRLAAE